MEIYSCIYSYFLGGTCNAFFETRISCLPTQITTELKIYLLAKQIKQISQIS